jgi:PEP-CTERM motif
MRSRLVLVVAALLALTPLTASAMSVFNWEGGCTLGCSGNATGVLTLADGANPYGFDNSAFVSFQFTSSSGSFALTNTSPYLAAQGGGWAGAGTFLEENAYGPNTLPLWQFYFNAAANPGLSLSSEPGAWQLLVGSYGWTCLDPQCAAWTNDVIRNVGVGGSFTATTPLPGSWTMMLIGLGAFGLVGWRKKRKGFGKRFQQAVTAA